MGRIQAGEVREAGGGVGRGPAQNMTQLWRIGVNRVPRHQKLQEQETDDMKVIFNRRWREQYFSGKLLYTYTHFPSFTHKQSKLAQGIVGNVQMHRDGCFLTFTASGTSLTASGSSRTRRVTSATMASAFLNLEREKT